MNYYPAPPASLAMVANNGIGSPGQKAGGRMRPPSVCSTDSSYSVVGRKHPGGGRKANKESSSRANKEEPIYSTFKPESVVATDNEEEDNDVECVDETQGMKSKHV